MMRRPGIGDTFTNGIDSITDNGIGQIKIHDGVITVGPVAEDALGVEVEATLVDYDRAELHTEAVKPPVEELGSLEDSFTRETTVRLGKTFSAVIDEVDDNGHGIIYTRTGFINLGPVTEDAEGEYVHALKLPGHAARVKSAKVQPENYIKKLENIFNFAFSLDFGDAGAVLNGCDHKTLGVIGDYASISDVRAETTTSADSSNSSPSEHGDVSPAEVQQFSQAETGAVSSSQIWFGEIDRLSTSSNAIVKSDDIWKLDGREYQLPDIVNLGKLPEDVVGEQVVFAYDTGGFGICLEEKWTTPEYVEEMGKKSGINPDDVELYPTVPDSFSKSQILIASPVSRNRFGFDFISSDEPKLAELSPLSNEEDWNRIGIVNGPFPETDGPIAVMTTGTETPLETRPALLTDTIMNTPQQGEQVTVTTERNIEQGTLARYTADVDIPILIPSVQYSPGEELPVKISSKNQSYLIGNVHIDPDETDTFYEGNEIEIEVNQVEGRSFIGLHKKNPVKCNCGNELSTECEGEIIRVTIQSVNDDRVVAAPTTYNNNGSSERARIIGTPKEGANAVIHKHLLYIPKARYISTGDKIRVGIEKSGTREAQASVSARSIFNQTKKQIVRLPETSSDLVTLNDTPVVTSHLPTVTSSVLLGVEEAHPDHIVPSVGSLPDEQLPDIGTYIETTLETTSETPKIAKSSELPVELIIGPEPSNKIQARVVAIQRNSVSAAVGKLVTDSNETLEEYHAPLQFAGIAYKDKKYQRAVDKLSEAYEACDQIPESQSEINALTIANRALVRAISVARSVNGVLNNHEIEEVISAIKADHDRFGGIKKEEEFSEEIDLVLSAYHKEIRAVEHLLVGLKKFNNEVQSQVRVKKINQNLNTNRQVRKAAKGIIDNLRETSEDELSSTVESIAESTDQIRQLVSGTKFEQQFPSVGFRTLIQEFRHTFYFKLNEFESVQVADDNNDLFKHFTFIIDESVHGITFESEPDTDETWKRQAPSSDVGLIASSSAEDDNNEEAQIVGAHPERTPSHKSDQTLIRDQADTLDHETAQEADTQRQDSPVDLKEASERERPTNHQDPEPAGKASTDNTPATQSEIQQENRELPSDSSIEPGSQKPKPISELGSASTASTSVPDDTPELRKKRKKAEQEATDDPMREDMEYSGRQYDRSEAVREYALARADGVCEACGQEAPFVKPDGSPYLEVHHVDELGEGGKDHPSFVAALCPTCHKEIHHGRRGNKINEHLKELLEEGLGEVGVKTD